MGRLVSESDYIRLRSFIRSVASRVAALESRTDAISGFTRRHQYGLALPVDDITNATFISDSWTAPEGEAYLIDYSSGSDANTYSKAAETRGKISIVNVHRGMWVWSNVLVGVFRESRSGRWIVDNLSGSHIVRGVAAASIAAGATNGSVNVFRGVTLERVVTNVRHDWMHAGTAIASGTQLLIKWFDEDICWRVIEAACP